MATAPTPTATITPTSTTATKETKMLIIDSKERDPWFNLASEEHLFRDSDNEFLILYINEASVIIGKHQNPAEEINTRFLRENNIPFVRRISGGGTVYHDKGNLNYTFISTRQGSARFDFSYFRSLLISFLASLGIDAYEGEKNEIRTGGLKISGNAEHVFRDRIMHHGTILFSADLQKMSGCLARSEARIKSRAVQSNRTRVTNLEGMITGIKSTEDLKKAFVDYIRKTNDTASLYDFSDEEIRRIKRLKDEKFTSWEWNYAYGPDYNFSKDFSEGGDNVSIELEVSKGIIRTCKCSGPVLYNSMNDLLPGTRHCYEGIAERTLEAGYREDKELIYNFLM